MRYGIFFYEKPQRRQSIHIKSSCWLLSVHFSLKMMRVREGSWSCRKEDMKAQNPINTLRKKSKLGL